MLALQQAQVEAPVCDERGRLRRGPEERDANLRGGLLHEEPGERRCRRLLDARAVCGRTCAAA